MAEKTDHGACQGHGVCPIAPVLEILGNPWKHQILWYLNRDTVRFNELRRRLAGITPRTLTRQLRDLERDGLVDRKQYGEIPPRVEYSSTELARSLRPVLSALNAWGDENLAAVTEARQAYDARQAVPQTVEV